MRVIVICRDTGLSLVQSEHMTWILASDWFIVIVICQVIFCVSPVTGSDLSRYQHHEQGAGENIMHE